MTYDDIDTLWYKAVEQSIAAGEKFTRYSFVELLKREMIRDGWRQCAEGQKTTQFCAQLEAAVAAEREACAKEATAFGREHPVQIQDSIRETAKSIAKCIRARGEI